MKKTMDTKVVPIGVKPKKVKFSKKNIAASNLAKRTKEYWLLSSACNSPTGVAGITFEEASRKIRNALQNLGPHRKAVRRFTELQHTLIIGAKKCPKKNRSETSNRVSFALMDRTQKIHTPPSQ